MAVIVFFLIIGFIIWAVAVAVRRPSDTQSRVPQSPAAHSSTVTNQQPASHSEPVIVRPAPSVSSRPKTPPPASTTARWSSSVSTKPPLVLFGDEDEVVRAVIYSEIFSPKFRR